MLGESEERSIPLDSESGDSPLDHRCHDTQMKVELLTLNLGEVGAVKSRFPASSSSVLRVFSSE